MDLGKVVVLALVQAFTEFLPISSSAHLVLVRWALGWEDPGLPFDVALHFGTLLALAAYFLPTWCRILGLAAGRRILEPGLEHPDRDLFENPGLLWFLLAATLPAVCAGLALQGVIESHLRGPFVIGSMLLAVGCVIWWADRRGQLAKGLDSLSFRGSMLIGCAQALALVPGTSRSGITIAAGLLLGLKRASAARFSFLLAMPVVFGAAIKTGWETLAVGTPASSEYGALAVGVAVSALAGYAVIALFLQYLQRATMAPFVYYRWALGTIVLGLAGITGPLAFLAGSGQDG